MGIENNRCDGACGRTDRILSYHGTKVGFFWFCDPCWARIERDENTYQNDKGEWVYRPR